MSKAIRTIDVYELFLNGELIASGTIKEICEAINKSRNFVQSLRTNPRKGYEMKRIGTREQVYALYHLDDFIVSGTFEEISNFTNLSKEQLIFIRSNVAEERGMFNKLIPIEGETVIVKRTHNAKYAPVHENEPIREVRRVKRPTMKVSIDQPVKQTELVINDYHKQLFDQCFKGWA
jgi:hypothetical protein